MPDNIPTSTLEKFTTFGDLLRYLRRRSGLTQVELSIAVGYSDPQISRLEQNLRLPDLPTIEARFVPALCLEDEPRAVSRLMDLAAAVRREDAPIIGICPYKGLDYFDEQDADLFVGREALSENLAKRVLALASKDKAIHGRFFTIVGASGSGKSSLVRAGLIPALRWNKTSGNWIIHVLTPTASPLESLANAMTREKGSLAVTAALMDDLLRDPRSLSLFIKRESETANAAYQLLVIDQFEELFTLCHAEHEREAFVGNLIRAAQDKTCKAIIVLALRADFYAHCANYFQLRECVAVNQVYIGAMSDDEMRRAIEEPARRGQWEFEPSLSDLILHDVGHEPGALPLLSHALYETWQRRHGRTMTLSGYASAGGVRGAIAETAEAVFMDRFTLNQQEIARRVFLRLTELGDEASTGDTRRRVKFNELVIKPEEAETTQEVIKTLADARLVTTSEDSVEVAHEALIREWPTLRRWLDDNREGLRLHRHLTEASQEWQVRQRDAGVLFRGARLVQACEWSEKNHDDLNELEKEFLGASVSLSENEAAERAAQQQRELEAARKLANTEKLRVEQELKSNKRLRLRTLMIISMSLLALLLAAIAITTWQRSVTQAASVRSRDLAAYAMEAYQSGRGDLALALALESVKGNNPPLAALSTLRLVASGPGSRAVLKNDSINVLSISFIPGTHEALMGGCSQFNPQGACVMGGLMTWDVDKMNITSIWTGHKSAITSVTSDLGGNSFISGDEEGNIFIWNSQGLQVGKLVGHTAAITGLILVNNTGSLLSSSMDGTLILWELQTGSIIHQFWGYASPVTAIAMSSGSDTVVSAHQGGPELIWDLYRSEFRHRFDDIGEDIHAVLIAPDGSWFATASHSASVNRLNKMDTRTGSLLNQLSLPCQPGKLVLSTEGEFALAACDATIYQVDIQSWTVVRSFIESPTTIIDLAISQDGMVAVSASRDGTLIGWKLGMELAYSVVSFNADNLHSMAMSADGKYILLNDAAWNNYEEPALWNIAQGKFIRTFKNFNGSIARGGIAISPDGKFVAAAGWYVDIINSETITPTIKIWSEDKNTLQCTITGLKAKGKAVAFKPGSDLVLVGTQDELTGSGELQLWNITTCQPVLSFDTDEGISSIDFSSDGKHAITGTGFREGAAVWDVSTGKVIRRFTYMPGGPVYSVMYSPDESSIFGIGRGEIYQWNVESGRIIRRFSGQNTYPLDMTISPDSKYVLSSTVSGDLILWDYSTGVEVTRMMTNQSISGVAIDAPSAIIYAATRDGKLIKWEIGEEYLPELQNWIKANRYVRELTCDEKLQYNVLPLCKP